jgi:hypothetical protein
MSSFNNSVTMWKMHLAEVEGTMRSWRFQKGELNVGCLIGAIVLVIVVLIAIKTVPVMLKVGDMQDGIVRIAERANLTRYRTNPKLISQAVQEKAEQLGLPVALENIDVQRRSNEIRIRVEYDVEIKYPGYTYTWHKVHDVTRTLF